MPSISASSDYHIHAPEVQVPTLGSINIPALTTFPQLSSSMARFENQHASRPSLQRIDTDVTSQLSAVPVQMPGRLVSGHRHSRSLEFPSSFSSVSTADTLDSANSDSFLLPSNGDAISHNKAGAPLPGLYISQASRNFSGWRGGTSIPPSPRTMSPLTPSPGPSSPVNDLSEDAAEAEDEADSEDVWDLVPYDISWGTSYFGYRDGTLPGPDGKCIFLRSPTPLKYQRTGQACEKCRERKAKCSGTRPSCARCITRGHVCQYAPEAKRSRADDSANEEEEDCFSSPFQRRSDLRPQYAHSRVAMTIPERPRANTELPGRLSHDGPTPTLTKPTLRRRHSTIELPVPLPLMFSDKPRLALRDTRSPPKEPGYLGLPLSLPGGDADGDDLYPDEYPLSSHSTSTCDSFFYSSSTSSIPFGLPPRSTDNIHSQIRPLEQDLYQTKWGVPFSRPDDTEMAGIDMQPSHGPDECFQANRTNASGQNHAPSALRYSISMPELEWAYQTASHVGAESFTSDADCAEIDFEMVEPGSTWAMSKVDAAHASVYPFSTTPHIDIMEHTLNFLPFEDQQIDAMVSSHLAFSMQSTV